MSERKSYVPAQTCGGVTFSFSMSALPLLDPTAVSERLDFARKRLVELQALNGGRLAGANAHERQQLIQEFFFHLLGAVDVLAQLVNEQRSLGHDSEVVTTHDFRWAMARITLSRTIRTN